MCVCTVIGVFWSVCDLWVICRSLADDFSSLCSDAVRRVDRRIIRRQRDSVTDPYRRRWSDTAVPRWDEPSPVHKRRARTLVVRPASAQRRTVVQPQQQTTSTPIRLCYITNTSIYIFIRQKAEETSEKKATDTQQQQQQKHTQKNTVKAGELVNTCLKN